MSVVNSKLGLTSHSRKREKRADDPAPLLIGMWRVACFPTLVVLCPPPGSGMHYMPACVGL